MSTNKYFPIKTATACQLKWTWSTIWLSSGKTASCHRIIPENIGLDEFDSFHNTEKKLNDRELMLDGKWPTGGCEYCQKIEQAGGSSDRMFQLNIPNLSPPELVDDITAISVTPKILEIYLNNTCNFSCLYCVGMHSSRIAHENKQYIDFIEQKDYKERFTTFQLFEETTQSLYMDKFLKWMEKNSSTLSRLHILGGEPFYQKEFEFAP